MHFIPDFVFEQLLISKFSGKTICQKPQNDQDSHSALCNYRAYTEKGGSTCEFSWEARAPGVQKCVCKNTVQSQRDSTCIRQLTTVFDFSSRGSDTPQFLEHPSILRTPTLMCTYAHAVRVHTHTIQSNFFLRQKSTLESQCCNEILGHYIICWVQGWYCHKTLQP